MGLGLFQTPKGKRHVHVCVCIYIYIHIHTYIYIYVDVYTHTYIHIHMYSFSRRNCSKWPSLGNQDAGELLHAIFLGGSHSQRVHATAAQGLGFRVTWVPGTSNDSSGFGEVIR